MPLDLSKLWTHAHPFLTSSLNGFGCSLSECESLEDRQNFIEVVLRQTNVGTTTSESKDESQISAAQTFVSAVLKPLFERSNFFEQNEAELSEQDKKAYVWLSKMLLLRLVYDAILEDPDLVADKNTIVDSLRSKQKNLLAAIEHNAAILCITPTGKEITTIADLRKERDSFDVVADHKEFQAFLKIIATAIAPVFISFIIGPVVRPLPDSYKNVILLILITAWILCLGCQIYRLCSLKASNNDNFVTNRLHIRRMTRLFEVGEEKVDQYSQQFKSFKERSDFKKFLGITDSEFEALETQLSSMKIKLT